MDQDLKIVLLGAGSKEFGPASTRDVLLSDVLAKAKIHLVLMDINDKELKAHKLYAEEVANTLGRKLEISTTTILDEALQGADFVISAIEIRRYYYWSQDFHIPRKYGFPQIYGENGGIGGLFHALRNFKPTEHIIKRMEAICPDAWLLNYTNPLTKLSEFISRTSSINFIGLCHGIFQGKKQLAAILERDHDSFKVSASGLNHFSWFHTIEDLEGNDLYPELKERESRAHVLSDWDEIALSRIMFRVFGLYPSPGANHIGEYVRWAKDFLASQDMQYFYDPARSDPWESNKLPSYLYNLNVDPVSLGMYEDTSFRAMYPDDESKNSSEICASGELAIPIIEGLFFNNEAEMDAVNMRNTTSVVPGLPEDAIVEFPAWVSNEGLKPIQMPELPTAALALLNTQCSINKLLVEAYTESSMKKLLQATLLDPTVDSYHNAVHCINEMYERQSEVLKDMHW